MWRQHGLPSPASVVSGGGLFQFASDAELPNQFLLTFPVHGAVGFPRVEISESLVAYGTGCLEKQNFSDHGIGLCIRVCHQVVLSAHISMLELMSGEAGVPYCIVLMIHAAKES